LAGASSLKFTSLRFNVTQEPMLHPAELGALTQLWAGTLPDPEGKELNGKYLLPWARVGSPAKSAEDPKWGIQLWEWCEEQIKDF